MTTGTSHFTTLAMAIRYYREYEPGSSRLEVAKSVGQKIAEGAIHIGKPELKPGETLSVIDDGARYAITGAPKAKELHLVSPLPAFLCDCVKCGKKLQSDREKILADVHGKPFVDYYCESCSKVVA